MWHTTEFGSSHEGKPAAVLADGSEPKPVYFDVGSSGSVPAVSEWWVYDGRLHAPKAAHLRGSCACGWRGESLYPIDWDQVEDARFDIEVSGPQSDWEQHVEEVRARSVPLPTALETLLTQVDEQLTALSVEAPLAALRGVAVLERITKRIGREAAYDAKADELSWDAIGQALGLDEKTARSRLLHYSLRS
ncbi:hypothetical protein ABZ370_08405 [Streptomyces sp. NPDC005962]|uniref:hypothetical protein n=1 Tax=Streptomyces sp. NPDC005962 TaxID=3154466 RepID=UPI0033D5E1A3